MKFLLLMLALAVSLSIAENPTAMRDPISSSGSGWQGSEYEWLHWSQPPNWVPLASQYFTDLYPDWDSGVANDFMFPIQTTVNIIRWWGDYWNTSEPFPIASPVEIYLYLDNGFGNAPTLPQHSSAIASWMIPIGSYDEVADGDYYLCEYVFPEWVVFDIGVTYWVEIRKAYAFDPYGQYGWVTSGDVLFEPCVQGFDGLGIDWWTPRDIDVAFQLSFCTSLEATTWAEIKTIF